ncbi:MAG: hypothetical protein HN429_02245 [Candidatus Magasanikbacteria bacterium]|nr:hypothetical protein [Candidatus Magasanikbacteria bacterium]
MPSWIGHLNKRKTTIGILIVSFFVVVFLFGVQDVGAVDQFGVDQVDETIELTGTDIRLVVARIIRVALTLLGIIAISLVIYGGAIIMTSAGNEARVLQGKKVLINAAIGLAIIFSSLAITQFIIVRLGGAISGRPGVTEVRPPGTESFRASGSLGRVVRDHYPLRRQTDVKRNTKIVVSFVEAIDQESIINDTNGNGIFGDCLENQDPFSWEIHCDHLNTEAVQITVLTDEEENNQEAIRGAALTTLEGEDQEAFTFVFKPFNLLGNDQEAVRYNVRLTENIIKKRRDQDGDDVSIFEGQFTPFYEWYFDTDTIADFEPPRVESIYPNSRTVPRNSIVQVTFTEAMDPLALQGIINGEDNSFTHLIFHDPAVTGEWRITNGYRTVEFIGSEACGQNSCGDIIYCLPVSCVEEGCVDDYSALIRTADTQPENSFSAIPFSGVVDLSDNALDAGEIGVREGKPPVAGNPRLIGEEEDAPDNVLWQFRVRNEIDRTAPYVESVTPALDASGIRGDAPLRMTFNDAMWYRSLGAVNLHEYPFGVDGLEEPWFYLRAANVGEGENDKTVLRLEHREFGPGNRDLYYFTSVSSTVKNVTQNCLYPGQGPVVDVENRDAQGESSPTCVVGENENCVPVTLDPNTDTGCVQTTNPGQDGINLLQPDITTCIDFLENISVR